MLRTFGSAAIAIAFAGSLCGIADAKHASSGTAVPALTQGLADVTTRDPAATSLAAPQFYLVSPDDATGPVSEARSADPAPAADGNPVAGADLKMWGGSRDRSPMRRFARGIISRTSSIAASLTRSAMRFIGTPYVFGGTSTSGFDCSGYVQHVFAMQGIALPRTADAQYYAGSRTTGGLRIGDLVFFETYEPGPSHVGIYLGSGRFVHSSSHGVMVSRIRDSYWSSRYLGGKRFTKTN